MAEPAGGEVGGEEAAQVGATCRRRVDEGRQADAGGAASEAVGQAQEPRVALGEVGDVAPVGSAASRHGGDLWD